MTLWEFRYWIIGYKTFLVFADLYPLQILKIHQSLIQETKFDFLIYFYGQGHFLISLILFSISILLNRFLNIYGLAFLKIQYSYDLFFQRQ